MSGTPGDDGALHAILLSEANPAVRPSLHNAILADFDRVQRERSTRGALRGFVAWTDVMLAQLGFPVHSRAIGRIASGGILAALTAMGFFVGASVTPSGAAALDEADSAMWTSAVDLTFEDRGVDWWVAE